MSQACGVVVEAVIAQRFLRSTSVNLLATSKKINRFFPTNITSWPFGCFFLLLLQCGAELKGNRGGGRDQVHCRIFKHTKTQAQQTLYSGSGY